MATGSISSLGAGSGLDLQNILDQLRAVDEQQITTKKDSITDLEAQLDEFTVVNNKLLTMKSSALDLSLSSTFLARSVTSSDEKVITATASEGATVQSNSVTVDRLASKSSWLSSGVSASTDIIYVPTSQESTTGVADPAVGAVMLEGETLTITFGGTQTIALTGPVGGWTMDDLVTQINNAADNQGGPGANGRYVTAETYVVGSDTYLRIKTDTVGGTGESNRVAISETLTGLDFSPPKDVFQYEFGPTGDTTVVTLNVDADTTLSGLVDLINNDTNNPGVTASIINDGSATNPYKLLLQADATGEDNRINITGQLTDMTLAEEAGAGGASLNSQVTIEGISYQRQTNTISDIFTGVTFSLVGTGSSTVAVSNNASNIKDIITSLVTAYNDAVQEIAGKVSYDETTEKFGILADTTLRDLPFDLQNLMTSSNKADQDGNITSLFDLGLSFARDGTISIDDTVLSAALSSNYSDVQEFFLGDDSRDITGFGDLVNDRLRTITGTTGQVAAEKTAAQARIDDLNLAIESDTERLDKKYDILTKQFVELDRYMNQMTSISDYLTSQFQSFSSSSGSSTK